MVMLFVEEFRGRSREAHNDADCHAERSRGACTNLNSILQAPRLRWV